MSTKNTQSSEKPKTEQAKPKALPSKKIILDNPHVVACGQYKSGEVYEVEGGEAERLIKVKGFRLAVDADTKKTTDKED